MSFKWNEGIHIYIYSEIKQKKNKRSDNDNINNSEVTDIQISSSGSTDIACIVYLKYWRFHSA